MPTITNFGDVITQGNTITQGTGFSSFAGALNAPTFYGAIAGSNTIAATTVSATTLTGAGSGITSLDMGNAGSGTLAVARGGTGVTSSTGTGSVVLSASPTLTGTVTAATVSATTLTGAGSGITSLDMGNAGSGTLAVARGGTGQVSAQAAMNALAGAVTSTQYLRGNGTNVVMAAIVAADVPTLNQNTSGTAGGLSGSPSITVSAVNCTGDVVAYYSASDDRLKNRLGKIENALEKVQALNGFMFKYNDLASQFGFETEMTHVGLSAQEVSQVLPEVVAQLPFENMNEYMRIQYEKIVPLLVEAIKELAGKNNTN